MLPFDVEFSTQEFRMTSALTTTLAMTMFTALVATAHAMPYQPIATLNANIQNPLLHHLIGVTKSGIVGARIRTRDGRLVGHVLSIVSNRALMVKINGRTTVMDERAFKIVEPFRGGGKRGDWV